MKRREAAAELLKPLEGEEEDEAPEASSESEDAARDALSAIKRGDAKAFDLALKRHYELCASGGGGDEEPDSTRY